jgi:superoxide reductase
MTKSINAIYKCPICGNIIEVVHVSGGTLVCCGQNMELLIEKKQDQGMEKHVPIIERTANGYKIKVGSITHPMEETHFIEWIELIADNRSHRHYLKPGEAPEAEFCINATSITARAYCNLHGLWQS